MFLVGGTNTQTATKLLQPIKFDVNQHNFTLNYLKTEHNMIKPRFNPTLGLIKEDTMICFGGTE